MLIGLCFYQIESASNEETDVKPWFAQVAITGLPQGLKADSEGSVGWGLGAREVSSNLGFVTNRNDDNIYILLYKYNIKLYKYKIIYIITMNFFL